MPPLVQITVTMVRFNQTLYMSRFSDFKNSPSKPENLIDTDKFLCYYRINCRHLGSKQLVVEIIGAKI